MSTRATVTLAAWAVLELGLRVREAAQGKGRTGRDRGTRVLIAVTLGAAIDSRRPPRRSLRCCGSPARREQRASR